MKDNIEKIILPGSPVRDPLDDLPHPVDHSDDFSFISLRVKRLTGKGVKVAIVDSGAPFHVSISDNITEHVNLLDHVSSHHDVFGHATMVSGVLGANSKQIHGIAPNVKFYTAKVSDNEGASDFNALVAGVLWAVVKRVDIIVIALSTAIDYPVLHNAIKKAYDENICIIAASSNGKNGDLSYPSAYAECLGFVAKPKNKNLLDNMLDKQGNVIVQMPSNGIITTYQKDQYIRVYGSSFAAAIGAGILACLIEQKGKKSCHLDILYKDLLALCNKQ